MNLSFLHPFQYLYKLFTKDDTPRQLAFGVALGMMIGLIPKGNLVAACLTVLLFAFKTNLGAGLLTIFCVSACATQLDPLLHGIGVRVLGNASVYSVMSRLYDSPLVPWTSLNNTVVLGGLLLGIALFYPAFHLSEMIFERYYGATKSALAKRFRRRKPSHSGSPEEPVDEPKATTPIPTPHLLPTARRRRASTLPVEGHSQLPSDVVVDWRRQ
ncbi:MAG: TIGR03546 family protein [Planctomycetales bacterium]|nr:TIGR03546 family protein [Planctomycetales bacterium]